MKYVNVSTWVTLMQLWNSGQEGRLMCLDLRNGQPFRKAPLFPAWPTFLSLSTHICKGLFQYGFYLQFSFNTVNSEGLWICKQMWFYEIPFMTLSLLAFGAWESCSLMARSTVTAHSLSTGRAEDKKINNPLHLKCGKELLHLHLILNRDRWYPGNWYSSQQSNVGTRLQAIQQVYPYKISICAAPGHLHNITYWTLY